MTAILAVLVFIAIGAAIGFVGSLLSDSSNRMISIVVGVAGSLAISWIASLLGLGAGFLAFSLWGIILGILGAAAAVGIYVAISRR